MSSCFPFWICLNPWSFPLIVSVFLSLVAEPWTLGFLNCLASFFGCIFALFVGGPSVTEKRAPRDHPLNFPSTTNPRIFLFPPSSTLYSFFFFLSFFLLPSNVSVLRLYLTTISHILNSNHSFSSYIYLPKTSNSLLTHCLTLALRVHSLRYLLPSQPGTLASFLPWIAPSQPQRSNRHYPRKSLSRPTHQPVPLCLVKLLIYLSTTGKHLPKNTQFRNYSSITPYRRSPKFSPFLIFCHSASDSIYHTLLKLDCS